MTQTSSTLPTSQPALQEVVVTATKQAADIEDVPMSITALTSQELERSGVTNFFDYATKVPNLTFASGHGIVNARQVAIRGIQGLDTTGFYIDDLPIPATMDPRVIDLNSIEVLRGPQGTLYGARSMGGTIRMITPPPDPDATNGMVHGTGSQVDGGGGGYQLDGSVNLPLRAGSIALRLNAFIGNDGSFINREFPTPGDPSTVTTDKVARNDFQGGMASLLWRVTDNFTVRPIVMTQYYTLNGFPLSDYSAGTLRQLRPLDVPESAWDKWTFGGVTLNYKTSFGDFTSASSWFSRQNFESEDYSQQLEGILGTPLLPASFLTWQPGHSFVEELRFASNFGGPVQLITGLYYANTLTNYDQNSTVPGLNAASGGAFGTDLVFSEWYQARTKEYAAFGELTYRFSERWSTTVGLRYTKIDTSYQNVLGGIASGGFPGSQGVDTEHKATPKVVVQYRASPEVMTYALASQGFRPGAAQTPPPANFCAADYAAAGVTPEQVSTYDADNLWNYEVGAKSRLFDQRLTINGDLFWIEWSALQQQVLFSCGYPYIANVGHARSRGAELEIEAAPLEGLTLSAGVGYTDAEITATSRLVPTQVGEPIQQVAPWTASLIANYSFHLAGAWRGIVYADYSYVDHSFSANNNPVNPRLRPAYEIANVRTGVATDKYEVLAFVSNVTDTHANLGDNQSQAAELPGRPRILVNLPRTYGLSATYRW
jgi:outer membrane receptor protein involved in Fe transport